jgi:TrmH family RNA methyltransferase
MITSSQNPKIENIRSLLKRRRERYKQGSFVLEGVRLIEDALQSGNLPQTLFFSENVSERGKQIIQVCREQGIEIDEINLKLMDSISDTQTSQGMLAIFPMVSQSAPPELHLALILDNVRDPGNLGTILRSAAAAGVQLVLLTPGTADVYSPKVLRAGMGAHFQLALQYDDWPQIWTLLKNERQPPISILLAVSHGGERIWDVDLKKPLALVIGSEASGASEVAAKMADNLLSIPMPGVRESLNAAMAASIILFEIVRQRRS